jgi:hypothetical protein
VASHPSNRRDSPASSQQGSPLRYHPPSPVNSLQHSPQANRRSIQPRNRRDSPVGSPPRSRRGSRVVSRPDNRLRHQLQRQPGSLPSNPRARRPGSPQGNPLDSPQRSLRCIPRDSPVVNQPGSRPHNRQVYRRCCQADSRLYSRPDDPHVNLPDSLPPCLLRSPARNPLHNLQANLRCIQLRNRHDSLLPSRLSSPPDNPPFGPAANLRRRRLCTQPASLLRSPRVSR